ncbi:hypothetical protein [Aquabacterium sp. J223]|uniref:hypothetical protein n=1 Tax=Aquabacterium sp. J223 TaxID=2898431 RepID=UPI0021AE2551|nr:hypothetical protein [Aquabacterium sp. J223]UUX93958.1 hypothetical protein LRS07_11350 [Aquabacterium sp. J223]
MRSVVVPAASGTVSTNAAITPFSEMAVAAAAKASGGLSAANVSQAKATVQTLLGFDPIAVDVKPLANATTPEQKQMAVLLGSVAQLAAAGSLGCNAGAVDCVVSTLAAATSTTTLKLSTGSTDVSAALQGAVATVLAKPEVQAVVSSAELGVAVANLGCSGTTCAAPAAVESGTATAIASAKSLFNNLRSDWLALFSGGGATASATGAVNQQAFKFRTAMRDVQVPLDVLAKDTSAIIVGIDLYNDYKAGRTTTPNRGKGFGVTPSQLIADPDAISAVGCTLYQDSALTTQASNAGNANFIGCRATYFVSLAGNTTQHWRHGFTLNPGSEAGSFTYATRARRTDFVNGAQVANVALQADGYSGTVTSTTNGDGHVTAVTIKGGLPGAFEQGGSALVNTRHTIDISGTRTISAPKTEAVTINGSLIAYKADGNVEGTLEVKSLTANEFPVSRDANGNFVAPQSPSAVAPAGGDLFTGGGQIVWTTPGAKFDGSLQLTESAWDKSLRSHLPTKLVASGRFSTLDGSNVTEFLTGTLELTVTGYGNYDAGLADSASNTFTTAMSFKGTVTAPQRPTLELTLGTSIGSHQDNVASVNAQYRSFAAGATAPTRVVTLTGSALDTASPVYTLTEAASELTLTWDGSAATIPLRKGGTTIGSLNRGNGLLTFTDQTFVSLDLGF